MDLWHLKRLYAHPEQSRKIAPFLQQFLRHDQDQRFDAECPPDAGHAAQAGFRRHRWSDLWVEPRHFGRGRARNRFIAFCRPSQTEYATEHPRRTRSTKASRVAEIGALLPGELSRLTELPESALELKIRAAGLVALWSPA